MPVNNAPEPGTRISQNTDTNSYGDILSPVKEFDIQSPEAYGKLVSLYPNAWQEYYGVSTPSYTPENAYKLQEAIAFWQYMNVGETIVTYPTSQPDANAFANQNSYGAEPVAVFPGEALEHPEGFYDGKLYQVEGLPKVVLNGEASISSHDPKSDIFSSGYVALDEYATTHRAPVTPYEWGSEYAVGKNVYGTERGQEGYV